MSWLTLTCMCRNMSALKVQWSIGGLETLPMEFEVTPIRGKIKTGNIGEVMIVFRSIQEHIYHEKLIVKVKCPQSFS